MSLDVLGRAAARIALGAVLIVGLLWVRALAEARLELARADQAAAQQDPDGRLLALARGVRWAAPLNLYAQQAAQQLLDAARGQRERGELEQARRTYRSLHGSLVASAGVIQLHGDLLAEADAALVELGSAGVGEPPSRAARHAAQHVPWSRLLALGGFALWVTAAFCLAQLGGQGPARATLAWRALLALGLAGCGLGLWLS